MWLPSQRPAPLAPWAGIGARERRLRGSLGLALAIILLVYAVLSVVPVVLGDGTAVETATRVGVACADLVAAAAAVRDRLHVWQLVPLAVALVLAACTLTGATDLGAGNAAGALTLVALGVLRRRGFLLVLGFSGLVELAGRARVEGLGDGLGHLDDYVIAASICLAASAFLPVLLDSAARADRLRERAIENDITIGTLEVASADRGATVGLLHDELLSLLRALAAGNGSPDKLRSDCEQVARSIEMRLDARA